MSFFNTKPLFTTAFLLASLLACVNEPVLTPVHPTANARLAATDDQTPIIRKGRYLLMATRQLPATLTADVNKANGRIGTLISSVGIATATSDDPDFAAKAARIPGIEVVVPEVLSLRTTPQDERTKKASPQIQAINPPNSNNMNPLFNRQWGLDAVNAPEAWQAGYKGAGVRVAVLSGGFDLDHPDLLSNIESSKSFVPGEGPGFPEEFSFSGGSQAAGIIAAVDNNIGIVGVAPEAKLLLYKVSGNYSFYFPDSWAWQAIVDAVDNQADVIHLDIISNFSRNGDNFYNDNGTPTDISDDYMETNPKLVQYYVTMWTRVTGWARQQGATLIAPTAFWGESTKYKSSINAVSGSPNVIGVAATTPIGWAADPTSSLDQIPFYANPGTYDVMLAGPGGTIEYFFDHPDSECTLAGETAPCGLFDSIISTGNGSSAGGDYNLVYGTGVAAAHVAGVAALIIGKNGGQMDPAHVEAMLKASADDIGKPGRDAYTGFGRVNAAKAVGASL